MRVALYSLALLCGLATLSCAKVVIADRAKKQAPPPPPPPQPTRGAGPSIPATPSPVPTPERIIRLNVAQVQPDAWWNSCLFLTINQEPEVAVGCGFDKRQIGKVIDLPAKKDFCNVIKLRMNVTTGCPPEYTCDSRIWDRKTGIEAERKFFKFVEGRKMFPADPDIHPEESVAASLEATAKQADAYQKAQSGNTWIRMYFEDQTEARYASWQAEKSRWREFGIDYNDYAIDLKGENVDFTIEGSGVACQPATGAAQPAAGQPPAAQPPAAQPPAAQPPAAQPPAAQPAAAQPAAAQPPPAPAAPAAGN
jgi:hypothetical protein